MTMKPLMRKRFDSSIYQRWNLLTFKIVHRHCNNPLIHLSLKDRYAFNLDTKFHWNIRNTVQFKETNLEMQKEKSWKENINRIILAWSQSESDHFQGKSSDLNLHFFAITIILLITVILGTLTCPRGWQNSTQRQEMANKFWVCFSSSRLKFSSSTSSATRKLELEQSGFSLIKQTTNTNQTKTQAEI